VWPASENLHHGGHSASSTYRPDSRRSRTIILARTAPARGRDYGSVVDLQLGNFEDRHLVLEPGPSGREGGKQDEQPD
jgi:hypothetical protein